MSAHGAHGERRRAAARTLTLVFLAVVAVAAAVVLWLADGRLVTLWRASLRLFEQRDAIRSFVFSFGAWAPAAFVALQALQVVISPIPGEATGFLGGFLFGSGAGFLCSTAGLTLGSALAFLLSRQLRRLVRSWLHRSHLYARFNHLIEHQGLFLCLILFLLPGFPKDLLCYLLGLSRMPWQAFVVVVTVGRIPGTLLLSLQGAEVYDGDFVGFFSVLFFTLVVTGPAWYYREAIYSWVERHRLTE